MGSWNSAVLGDDARRSAATLERDVADVVPADCGGAVMLGRTSGEQLGDRGLARAGGRTRAVSFPAGAVVNEMWRKPQAASIR